MSYVTLRGHWCDITVLNVRVTTEDESDDAKDKFYEEQEYVLDQFPKYHVNILLGDFKEKGGRKIFSNQQLGRRRDLGFSRW